jgi:hypothetical protein
MPYIDARRTLFTQNLERLALMTTIKDILVKYVDEMMSVLVQCHCQILGILILFFYGSSVCGKHTYLAITTRSEVEKALAGPDTHDLAASLRRALSFSIPPVTFFRNFRVGGHSDAIFGVTLVDYATSRDKEDEVPKIIRVCIEEVEKRGLNVTKIYSVSS